ncbi:SDR family NAD(P)-dependent oxidoreductase [Thiotrichales bacterium 19S3-7]|nr:SDR family NAD(P)-dependent oxidoreductase [Thiotrichales bacterium 19S3-7]MCF6800899.1 SDR family NAD(P)-dependent oxidoreductase [Thiotrichales bacterium 19S3-11]
MKPTVLITGASSGFGRACAEIYNQNDYPTILIARRYQRLEAIKSKFTANAACHIAEVDITNVSQIKTFLAELPEAFKPIGILINNAGLALGAHSFDQLPQEDYNQMIDVNIKGTVELTHLVLPEMIKNNSGHIINIGSIAGSWPYPGGNVYCATKAFIAQFSRGLRADLLGKNIRVTNIEPGLAETEFSNVRFKGDDQKAQSIYHNTKPLTAKDIAETVFFASSMPKHVNINSIEVMPTVQSWSALAVWKTD